MSYYYDITKPAIFNEIKAKRNLQKVILQPSSYAFFEEKPESVF